MVLVIQGTAELAVIGREFLLTDGRSVILLASSEPKHAASTGRVTVLDVEEKDEFHTLEYFPSVIECEFVESSVFVERGGQHINPQ
ncbi:MAG: hypothetical protein CMB80_31095 [Flammeovirgaceae bacterium]|nr:hypothetical protein [Flammeovirgaceae bacterium]|tara:strand:- start:278 stop:535 length:258 start_codon:yes stop_codon:yes gene_type:complete